MLDPLGGQRLALARDPTAVLLLRRRYPDHRTDARLASFVRQQRPNQRFSVDSIGLRATASTRYLNRGGINDVALDPLALQHPMNPEPVQSRLLNDDDRETLSRSPSCLLSELRETHQQPRNVPARNRVLRHLFPTTRRQ